MAFLIPASRFSSQGPLGSPQPGWPPASRITESLPAAVGSLASHAPPRHQRLPLLSIHSLSTVPNLDSHVPTCTHLHQPCMPSSVSSPPAAERHDEGVAGQSTSAVKWAPWFLSLCQAGWVLLSPTDASEPGTRGRLVFYSLSMYSPCLWDTGEPFPGPRSFHSKCA